MGHLDGRIQAIHHGEGRYVFEYEDDGTTFKRAYHEYVITDHLGNVRVRFADLNGDKKINVFDEGPGQEKELLGSFHYYPYGLKMEGVFHDHEGPELRYQYNGIEYLSHAGLDVIVLLLTSHMCLPLSKGGGGGREHAYLAPDIIFPHAGFGRENAGTGGE